MKPKHLLFVLDCNFFVGHAARACACSFPERSTRVCSDEQLERVAQLAADLDAALDTYKAFLDALPPFEG